MTDGVVIRLGRRRSGGGGGGGGRRRGRAEYAIPSKYYNTKMQSFEMHFAPAPPPHVNLQLGFQGSLQIPQTGREPW